MDYAVGSVAALISGNVTPNRPRLIRRALTPTKHQQSPNVTPKSECVDDRSVFLSPSLQKKKAIVKKSPKRIFQNPDLDVTNDEEGSSVLLSPKADKVKKHLKEDLEADEKNNKSPKSPKSPKKAKGKLDQLVQSEVSKKKISLSEHDEEKNITEIKNVNESTPKKKKKQKNSISVPVEDEKENAESTEISVDDGRRSKKRKSQTSTDTANEIVNNNIMDISPKKKKKNKKSQSQETENMSTEITINVERNADNQTVVEKIAAGKNVNHDNSNMSPKKKKKNKKPQSQETENMSTGLTIKNEKISENQQTQKKKKKRNRKGKNKAKLENNASAVTTATQNQDKESTSQQLTPKKKNKTKNVVNPNAITNKDSDSEHESDDEIYSENERTNNQILDAEPADTSDEEEDDKKPQKQEKPERKERNQGDTNDEVKRTLFVGNVPFSAKCKKEIKRIFSKYGEIETVRIRTVPVKDARVTPKLAVIKNELHPERSTVNVYVRFEDASSVDKALVANNTVLNNNHLRVTRSDTTGVEHDPHKAIFVGNLPFAIEDDALRAKFEQCGEIESVRVVRDGKTNAGKGFGYVNFASKDGVELALAMSEEDLTIKNRILRVKRCTLTNKNSRPKGNQQNERFRGRSQGMKQRSGSFGGREGRNQGNFRGEGRSQGGFDRSQRSFDRSQGNFDRNQGQDGAHRRILKKRQNEESVGSSGPASKRPNIVQPVREKKQKKEFVGMTAEKKKKHKFNKGDKKKKALSEILTKYS